MVYIFTFLKAYMNIFDSKNTIIVNSEKLLNSPRDTMKSIFEFLEVEDHEGKYPLVNQGIYSKKIDRFLLNKLSNFFKPHNYLLEDLIGEKLDWQ